MTMLSNESMGAGGACPKHGVYQGHVCPDCAGARGGLLADPAPRAPRPCATAPDDPFPAPSVLPRERTMKQQAVYHVLLRYDKPVKRSFVMPERATLRLPNLPQSLVDLLPQSEGTARDILEALVRRGDARRLPGSPALYRGIPANEKEL